MRRSLEFWLIVMAIRNVRKTCFNKVFRIESGNA
jgi:hypothetical protein